MPPQSQAQAGPERRRRGDERRAQSDAPHVSGRAQRRIAAEQAAKRKRLFLLGGAVAAALVVALVLILVNRPPDLGAPVVAAEALPASIQVDGQTMGAADAPVTLVEWADYTCPHCGEFTRSVEPNLVSQYVETGKVKFEFRDYAFLGPQAVRAAEAAACAADQGAFWRYHDTLYLNQNGAGGFTDARLKSMAETLGLDTAKFNTCFDSGTHQDAVQQSRLDGQKEGVNATPSLFVNGTKVDWQGWDPLKQAIDAALAKK
jgi:protein-disulfide isomerase